MCLAIPGQIVGVVDEANRLAKVDVAGVRRNVDIGLLDDGPDALSVGDWVLIQFGFASPRSTRRRSPPLSFSRAWARTTKPSSRNSRGARSNDRLYDYSGTRV